MTTFDRTPGSPFCRNCGYVEAEHTWKCDACGDALMLDEGLPVLCSCDNAGATLFCPARRGDRVQELLENNIRLVEERRGVDLHAMVRQFHHAGAAIVRHSPEKPSDDELRFRFRLIAEEFFEQFDACFPGALQRQLVADAKDRIRQVIELGPVGEVDLPVLVDAWADLKYVIVGSEVQFGVDGNAVFRVVHRSNMEKFGPGAWRDEHGKVKKPPGWTPPDIAGELERQRREEAKR